MQCVQNEFDHRSVYDSWSLKLLYSNLLMLSHQNKNFCERAKNWKTTEKHVNLQACIQQIRPTLLIYLDRYLNKGRWWTDMITAPFRRRLQGRSTGWCAGWFFWRDARRPPNLAPRCWLTRVAFIQSSTKKPRCLHSILLFARNACPRTIRRKRNQVPIFLKLIRV